MCTSTPSRFLESVSQKYGIPLYVRDGSPSLKEDWTFCLKEALLLGAEAVTIAHQDDIYLPQYAGCIKRAFEDEDVLLAFTGAGNINASSEPVSGGAEKIKKILRFPLTVKLLNGSRFWKKASLSFGNPVPCPACTYNVKKLGTELFSEKWRFVTDWDAVLKIAEKDGRIVCIEKPLVDIRLHDSQETMKITESGARTEEEYEIFQTLHSAPAAKLLMHFYKKGQEEYLKDSSRK